MLGIVRIFPQQYFPGLNFICMQLTGEKSDSLWQGLKLPGIKFYSQSYDRDKTSVWKLALSTQSLYLVAVRACDPLAPSLPSPQVTKNAPKDRARRKNFLAFFVRRRFAPRRARGVASSFSDSIHTQTVWSISAGFGCHFTKWLQPKLLVTPGIKFPRSYTQLSVLGFHWNEYTCTEVARAQVFWLGGFLPLCDSQTDGLVVGGFYSINNTLQVWQT